MVLSNRYEVRRRLGAGGIGVVHEAWDRHLGVTVAIKLLHPHLRSTAQVLDAFRREVAISRLLDHPAVARIHDVGADTETHEVYLVLEYLGGGDLKRRLLTRGPLAAGQVVALARDLLGALSAAHVRGVIHRDVKPQNILFDTEGAPRLADFGLARCGELVGLDDAHRVVGTPEYLAPECVQGAYADARSDLYSLGAVLYEAATGHPPFAAGSVYELLRLQADHPAPELDPAAPGYDPRLAAVIARLLEKDPARRYQTAEDTLAALDGDPTPASSPADAGHPCPGCGEPVADAFPYCFTCRREPLILTERAAAIERWKVVVTGPGKPGDQLRHELRSRALDLVRDSSVRTRRLAQRLPRVPFVLLAGLSGEDARRLVEALVARGLEAEALPARAGGATPETRAKIRRKDAILSARVVGILLATMGGTFGSLSTQVIQHGRVGALGAVLILLLVGAPLVTLIRNRVPQLQWGEGPGPDAADVMARFLALAPRISSPALQALARRIVLRFEEIGRLAPADTIGGDAIPLVLQSADWIEAAQGLEDRLAEGTERGLYRRLADLRGAEADPELIVSAERGLDSRRKMERAHGVLLDRILSFSARLDRLALTLGSRGIRAAGDHLGELEKVAADATLAVRAIGEVDAK